MVLQSRSSASVEGLLFDVVGVRSCKCLRNDLTKSRFGADLPEMPSKLRDFDHRGRLTDPSRNLVNIGSISIMAPTMPSRDKQTAHALAANKSRRNGASTAITGVSKQTAAAKTLLAPVANNSGVEGDAPGVRHSTSINTYVLLREHSTNSSIYRL